MFIVDGVGGWSGSDILTFTGTALPPIFSSSTNRVGVFFFYDLTPNTGATFKYTVTQGTSDTTGILEVTSPVTLPPTIVQAAPVTILTVIKAILRGLFSLPV